MTLCSSRSLLDKGFRPLKKNDDMKIMRGYGKSTPCIHGVYSDATHMIEPHLFKHNPGLFEVLLSLDAIQLFIKLSMLPKAMIIQ